MSNLTYNEDCGLDEFLNEDSQDLHDKYPATKQPMPNYVYKFEGFDTCIHKTHILLPHHNHINRVDCTTIYQLKHLMKNMIISELSYTNIIVKKTLSIKSKNIN